MQRFGTLTKLKPDMVGLYQKLHDEIWDEVVAAAFESNMRNFTIFRHGYYLFSYYEYIGEVHEADMQKKNALPILQKWHAACHACFESFEGELMHPMAEIFHNDFKGGMTND